MTHLTRVFAARVTLGLLLAVLTACGGTGADPLTPEQRISGEYVLREVNGRRVPALFFQNPAGRIDMISGTLTLRDGGTYSSAVEVELLVFGSSTERAMQRFSGTWALTADGRISFVPDGSDNFPYTGTADGTAVRYRLTDVDYLWSRP